MLALVPALALALFAAGCGLAGAYAPPATGEVAVVFSPFATEAEAFAAVLAAGGQIVNPGRFGNVVIANAPDTHFAERVRAQGALLLLAATGLCGPAAKT
jgi:hypothetical protein